jgi:hypothetical protein
MAPLKLIVTTISEATAGHKAEFWPRTLSPNPPCEAKLTGLAARLLTDCYLQIVIYR